MKILRENDRQSFYHRHEQLEFQQGGATLSISIPRLSPGLAIFAVLSALLSVPLKAEPIRISGHIWSPDTSHGVAGVQIELLPAWEGYAGAVRRLREGTEPRPLATAGTDKDGFYEISAPEAGAYRLRLHAEGYLAEELPLVPLVEDTAVETDALSPAEPVEARAISGDGKALPGLAVKVVEDPENQRIQGGPHWHVAERGGVTDAGGRLSLWGRHGERLKLMAVSPAFLGEVAVWKAGSPPLRFLPKPVSKLEVRAADGKPVAGALVRWQSWTLGLTGADGRFPLAFPSGSEPLRAESSDGGAGQGTAPPGSKAAALLSIRLEPPRVVAGQVLQQAVSAREGPAKPVPGALVWTGSRLLGAPVRAGADGKFLLTLPTVEEVSLKAAASGFQPSESQFVPRTSATPAKPAVLRLEPAARIAGQVVDAAGNPVSQTYVRISMQGFQRVTLSRADGGFQLSGLQFQKSYELKGFHRDYADGETKARTAAPGQTAPPVKIVMGAGVTAFGHVADGDGKPLQGVRVTLTSARSRRFPMTTDAAGRFEVKAVDTGKLTLRARSTGFAPVSRPVEIPAGTPQFDLGTLELPAAAVVEGEVTDTHGTPIAGAVVESYLRSFDPFQWAEDLASPRPEVKTSPEGRFRLTDLPRGTPVQLQIEHEGYIPLKVPGVEAPLQAPLHLEMKTARGIAGRVVGPDGEPVGGATLSRVQESHTGGSAQTSEIELGITDARGSFQVSGFEPGPNDLRVAAEGYATKTVRGVTIPADRDLEGLEVVLGRGTILQVRVLSADGGPVAGARVRVALVQPGSGRQDLATLFQMPRMQTDERGTCQGELPQAGTYRVTASVDQRSASIEVTANAGTTPAEIRFPAGVQASGRVTDAQGQALSGVYLSLAAKQGQLFHQGATSGEDGAFVFTQVPDGAYRLRAERQGFKQSGEPLEVAVAGSDVQGLDLQLEPVTGATLTGHLLGLGPEELAQATVRGYGGEAGSPNATVEPDGRYEIKNVGAGDWRFTAITTSQRTAQQRIKIQPGEAEAVLDFEFGKGGTLSGTVLVEGSPLSGANVRVTPSSSEGGRAMVSRYDGHFEFHDVQPGRYILSVSGALGAVHQERTIEIDGDREMTIDIPMGTLAGQVMSAGTGEPIVDATVSIDGQESDSHFYYSTPTTRSGGEGAFESRLAPGKYRIKIQKEGFAPAEATAEVRPGGAGDVVEIRLKPVGAP
jgi:protocatechuate 3,4-dioxygenase beta subunit